MPAETTKESETVEKRTLMSRTGYSLLRTGQIGLYAAIGAMAQMGTAAAPVVEKTAKASAEKVLTGLPFFGSISVPTAVVFHIAFFVAKLGVTQKHVSEDHLAEAMGEFLADTVFAVGTTFGTAMLVAFQPASAPLVLGVFMGSMFLLDGSDSMVDKAKGAISGIVVGMMKPRT